MISMAKCNSPYSEHVIRLRNVYNVYSNASVNRGGERETKRVHANVARC